MDARINNLTLRVFRLSRYVQQCSVQWGKVLAWSEISAVHSGIKFPTRLTVIRLTGSHYTHIDKGLSLLKYNVHAFCPIQALGSAL